MDETQALAAAVEQYMPLSMLGAAGEVASLFEPDGVVDEPAGGAAGLEAIEILAERRFIWLAERTADVAPLRTVATPGRVVHECVIKMTPSGSIVVELPVALVGEPGPAGLLARLRVYHSTWPLTGRHEVRPPLLPADPSLRPEGAVASYLDALDAGDVMGVVAAFAAGGYAREPAGGAFTHRGLEGLTKFYAALFSNGGGVALEHCSLTDNGVAAALEYTCVRWGATCIPPQAGVAVYERGPDGLLAAARIYDDVDPPLD